MLRGQKILIRPLEEDDVEILYQWYNDQEVNYWASGAWPLNTLLSKEAIMDKFLDKDSDVYRYAILNKEEQAIGTIGFYDFNIPARSATLFINIGDKAYWDKGYGTDALITFIHFLFTQWNLRRISLDTWDGNLRALKSYQKIGFLIEGRQREARYVKGEYRDAVLLGLLKKDFMAVYSSISGLPNPQR